MNAMIRALIDCLSSDPEEGSASTEAQQCAYHLGFQGPTST